MYANHSILDNAIDVKRFVCPRMHEVKTGRPCDMSY